MIKTKLLLNYPTKFQSIRKSFSIFDIYDKINDILKRKHILSKKLKNMYGGGDTKQVYDLQQILQSIEEMNGELGTLEANLIVGFKNFPSFDTNVNTMNEFLKGVIDNIKNEQENHKDKYESINSIINDQFNTKVTIDGVEYETKNNILEEASKALSQQIKNKNFKDAYGIIKSVYEEYKKIYKKKQFDNWDLLIQVLSAWNVLLPNVATKFGELGSFVKLGSKEVFDIYKLAE